MSLLLVNNEKNILGKLTVERILEEYINEKHIACHKIIITGVLDSQSYVEELEALESDRFRVSGVQVFKEVFGSEDNRISYYFVAEKLEILNNDIYIEFEENKDKKILTDMNSDDQEEEKSDKEV